MFTHKITYFRCNCMIIRNSRFVLLRFATSQLNWSSVRGSITTLWTPYRLIVQHQNLFNIARCPRCSPVKKYSPTTRLKKKKKIVSFRTLEVSMHKRSKALAVNETQCVRFHFFSHEFSCRMCRKSSICEWGLFTEREWLLSCWGVRRMV